MNFRLFIILDDVRNISLGDITKMDLEELKRTLKHISVRLQAPRLTPESRSLLNDLHNKVWSAYKAKQRNPEKPTIIPVSVAGLKKSEISFSEEPTFKDDLHTWAIYYRAHPEQIEGAINKIKRSLYRSKPDEALRLNMYLRVLRDLQRKIG